MKNICATEHAKSRMQQRGIGEIQVRLLKEFGVDCYQKGGANFTYLPEKTLAQLRHAIDKLANIRIIQGESDVVVTAMHERRRVRKTQYVA